MKTTLIAITLTFSFSAFAGGNNCDNAETQSELNICSAHAAKEALIALDHKVAVICSQKKDIVNARGGSVYPLLLNLCIAEKLEQITKNIR